MFLNFQMRKLFEGRDILFLLVYNNTEGNHIHLKYKTEMKKAKDPRDNQEIMRSGTRGPTVESVSHM